MQFQYYMIRILRKFIFFSSVKSSVIDKTSKIGLNNQIFHCNINRYTYTGENCNIIEAEIGSFCSIASNCIIGGAAHPVDWVSTSPVFHKGRNVLNKNFSDNAFEPYQKTIIKNDVWIGSNSLVKAGVTIENGAVIGMGSVVTKNIPPYEIWAGNPARFIRKRFDDETINALISLKWWEWDNNKLSEYAKYSNVVNEFIKNAEGTK